MGFPGIPMGFPGIPARFSRSVNSRGILAYSQKYLIEWRGSLYNIAVEVRTQRARREKYLLAHAPGKTRKTPKGRSSKDVRNLHPRSKDAQERKVVVKHK